MLWELQEIYESLLVEGIDEKIPKLLNLVDNRVEDKETYIRWAAETFDPSKSASYITWILRMLKKGVLAGEEDGQKVKDRLTQLEELKRKPQFPKDKRDINSYKTYGDLAETLDEFAGVKTKGEMKRGAMEEGIQFIASSTGKEGSGISLYIVTTEEAGAKYFRETEWCVKDPRYFNQYNPPYYFFTKDGQPKTLLHLDSNQCMDVRDRPTDLNSDEQSLMETEEMTDYVIANDNSDSALSFYSEKVGEGFDGKISSMFWEKIDNIISTANSSLKMFNISEPYSEELQYYQPEASGSIPYDLTPYEDHLGDKEFMSVVRDVLDKFDIYPDDNWEYGEPFSDDMDEIYITMRYSDDNYRNESITDKLESFVKELEYGESKFDPEEFDEIFKEKMLKAGYMSSGFSDFTNKVSISNLPLENFKKNYSKNVYETGNIPMTEERFDYSSDFNIVDIDYLRKKYKRSDHPYVLLVEFLAPFVQRGLEVDIRRGMVELNFRYEPKYKEDKTGKQYIRGLKAIKDFDTHFDFYIKQIKRFMDKYVFPYMKNMENGGDSYGIPEDIKLPLMQIKGRKESPDQGMLDLHEKKTFSQFFYKKYGKIS